MDLEKLITDADIALTNLVREVSQDDSYQKILTLKELLERWANYKNSLRERARKIKDNVV